MQLYNNLSAKERADLIEQAGKDRLTISFYKYAKIGNTEIFRNHMFLAWNDLDVLGRIYIAKEGINAQLSVPADNFHVFKTHLDSITFLENVRLNIALEHDNFAFLKLKVKVRDKIVADGLNDDTFDVTDRGVHVDADTFNKLMDDPNTVLVDMRNHYESEIGHFKNAITPDVDTFRESLDIIEEDLKDHKEDKNLVMYCTGGIRCEKASAYYKHKGFKNVFQLDGGIINYVRQVNEKGLENKFIGKNFVFDERRSERISDDVIAHCHQCGKPADLHTNCANEACHLLFIQCDECKKALENCCSTTCMEVHRMPYEEQKTLRKGQGNSNDIFKKGRTDHLPYKKDLRNIFDTLAKKP
uniref:oxygen-dependent tRNA uridine(34) hydroxylase TrhO n=1 Tax=Gelidibacter sp. TaxID=2018083 RepID=UPI004049ED09